MERILSVIIELLLPLRHLDSPESIKSFLEDLGYAFPEDVLLPASPIDFNAIMSQSLELATRLQTANALEEKLAALLEAEDLVSTVIDGANSLQITLETSFEVIPQFITNTGFQENFLPRLVDYLIIKYLRKTAPRTHSLLELIGLISVEAQQENLADYQSECALYSLRLDRIPNLIQSPTSLVNDLYDWESQFDSNLFLEKLSQIMMMFGLAGNSLPDDSPTYNEVVDEPEPERQLFMPLLSGGRWPDSYWQFGIRVEGDEPGGNQKKGLAIVPYAEGEVEGVVSLGQGLELELTINAALQNGIGVFLHPPSTLEIQENLFSQPVQNTDVEISLELRNLGAAEKIILLGSVDTSHLAANEFSLKAGVTNQGGDSDLYLELTLPDLSLVIDAGEGDNFIQQVLAALTLEAKGDLLVGTSLSNGFYIGSTADLSLQIPINKILGPFYIYHLDLSLGLETSYLQIESTLTGSITLGPFELTLDNLGLSSELDWDASQGLLGDINLSFQFKPPDGAGFSIDTVSTGGVVSGGGYLSFDKDISRYSGALSIDVMKVGLSAIGVLDTKLPNAPKDWALFFSLAANFPSLPLGFGFFLTGVGGIVCINRTMDTEALAEGLIEGVLDSIMFPEDVLEDAVDIINEIDTYFPIAQDAYVFGPLIEIGWGAPTVISGELGVMLNLPSGELAILGSISTELPTPDAALLTLHMDVLGVIDFAEGTLTIVASLYDSRLLSTIELSGDMALYGRSTNNPYFLLSVGGNHPEYTPEPSLPSVLFGLDRMRSSIDISEDVFISLESYFAVTSNTIQYGASLWMEASAKVLLTTYTAKGEFSFHVLIVFTPFTIMTDLSASVGIYANDKELSGIHLSAHLEGPKPWYANGKATFNFFGIDINFQIEVGGKQVPELPDLYDVETAVLAALRDNKSWSALRSENATSTAITFIDKDDDTSLIWARPDDSLEVRQTVCPLDREIEVYGEYSPLGAREMKLENATIENDGGEQIDTDWDPLTDWFAPAQYERLSDNKRLSGASYEEMHAGVSFGTDIAQITAESKQDDHIRGLTPAWEELIIDEDNTRKTGIHPATIAIADSIRQGVLLSTARGTYVASAQTRRVGVSRSIVTDSMNFDITTTTYSVVDTADARIASTGTQRLANSRGMTYGDAVRLLEDEISLDKRKRNTLRVTPSYAVDRAVTR